MSLKITVAMFLLQLSGFFGSGSSGKVLVWPVEFSHWLNLRTILDELLKKCQEVTVLKPSISRFYKGDKTSAIEFEIYPSSFSKAGIEEPVLKSISRFIYELPKQTFWRYFLML